MLKLKRMAPTELFSGSKNRKQKKTVPSRETNGSHPQSMLEIGVIIAKKVLVSSTIKMATSMKVCGLLIKDMVKALTGEMKTKSSDVSILVIGLKIKSTVEELSFTRTEIVMMVIG
jgi:hypothetical protein